MYDIEKNHTYIKKKEEGSSTMVIQKSTTTVFVLNFLLQILCCATAANAAFSRTYTHSVNHQKTLNNEYIWQSTTVPFSELIFSWNALRPKNGKFVFHVSVLHSKWSNWIKVAEWGSRVQRSFSSKNDHIVTFRVAPITLKNKIFGKGFKIRVTAINGASLHEVKYLFACASTPEKFKIEKPNQDLQDILIDDVPKQSQMVLHHEKPQFLCAPTSTSTVINYFLRRANASEQNYIDPTDFAEQVRDQFFGVYGNSVLNVAAAFDASGGKVPCCVERLNNFEELHSYLKRSIPVVVSIHGYLRGGAMPYKAGHLMVVIGWDHESKSVVCIDPAFKPSSATETCYALKDFLKAWSRSRNLSYVFMPDGL